MVTDAIELGFPIELFKRGVVILMCFDMGVEKREGQVTAIDKDAFKDVRVLASRWNALTNETSTLGVVQLSFSKNIHLSFVREIQAIATCLHRSPATMM